MAGLSERDGISVSELKNFELCPAIPWIRRKLGWSEPVTFSMGEGKRADFSEVVRQFPDPKEVEVYLFDRETGLHGVADLISRDEVVELKAFSRVRFSHFRVQLLGYAFLAVRSGRRVSRASLVMSGREKLSVEVGREHLEAVESRVYRLREVLDSDSPPAVNPDRAKCYACQYRRVCPVTPWF